MKRLSISISVFFLGILVILGSGGFTISKMICEKNVCPSSYFPDNVDDCCDNENQTETSISCCELIDVSFLLDAFSISEKVNVSANQFPLFIMTRVPALYSSFFIRHSLFCSDSSPPKSANYLHFIGSLLL